ncbi:unnamed protein product [Blepharisma stoltei]|uniref:3-hydroxyisobutyryl-CoA hydrolase n=1 Tax=Blepharisma stoltei TaxID=1481888 RepID=A0AAU9JGL0_9CILI|nr:unnamed protein product [Blepharisma stoltei]
MERLQMLRQHLSSNVLHEDFPRTRIFTLNRPERLNSLNYEMIQTISDLINTARNKNFVFQSCTPKAFSAGGDILAIFENPLIILEFYRAELSTIYQVYKQPTETLAILRGLCIGAGNGIAMACKYRVCTETTRFSMPESAVGLVPDAGASYFFSHLSNKSLGLYIMLTGKALDGIDLYWAGLSTHYIPEAQIPIVLEEIKSSSSLHEVLDKYHQPPLQEKSKLLMHLTEIEDIFTDITTIDDLFLNLSINSTPFKNETKLILAKLCPLSLKLALKTFKLGLSRNLKEVLEQDYSFGVQLGYRRSYNFMTAVTKKLVEKVKEDIKWYPEDIKEVTEEMVNTIITNPEGPFLQLES